MSDRMSGENYYRFSSCATYLRPAFAFQPTLLVPLHDGAGDAGKRASAPTHLGDLRRRYRSVGSQLADQNLHDLGSAECRDYYP